MDVVPVVVGILGLSTTAHMCPVNPGRAASYLTPPGQIPASGITALGSCLRSTADVDLDKAALSGLGVAIVSPDAPSFPT